MLRRLRGSQWLPSDAHCPGALSHLQGLWQHLSQHLSHTAQQGPLPVCQASWLHSSWGLQPIEGLALHLRRKRLLTGPQAETVVTAVAAGKLEGPPGCRCRNVAGPTLLNRDCSSTASA